MAFDPNGRAPADSGIFGLPTLAKDAKVILIPVPWEATTSYGSGTSNGPDAILEASHQVDLFDLEYGRAYEAGFHMLPPSKKIKKLNTQAKRLATKSRQLEDLIFTLESGPKPSAKITKQVSAAKKARSSAISQVNDASQKVNQIVLEVAREWLAESRILGLVGGDHSSPLGLMQAISENLNGDFGILHIDAHHDLRDSYEGFQFSHASIFHNVMESKWAPKSLVQVGIRDFSEDEHDYAKKKNIHVHYDLNVQKQKAQGENWLSICDKILLDLPKNVYVSFDIDGLSPAFCPHTGTPVPGGIDFSEALILISRLKAKGKKIVGFDLNEVAPGPDGDEWDANVGARLLYKLCAAASS